MMPNSDPMNEETARTYEAHIIHESRMVCSAAEPDTNVFVNEVLGKTSDVPPGTKKVFTVREKPILVINDNGTFYATSGICAHYNSPFENGVYFKGKIRCPLHGSCYNVKTGDIEDYPGFDSIFTYDVKDVNGDLVLNTPEETMKSSRRTRKSNVTATTNEPPIIVVGAGVGAEAFAEHARLLGCATPITMITEDDTPPYDRVLLSKKPTTDVKDARMRSDEYYKENFIDVITNAKVTGVDLSHRKINLETGDSMQFSRLVLALGGLPKKLTCPGADLKNVYTLRYISNANKIAAESVGKNVVCIGGSFIGMEIASALSKTAASVTVVCTTDEPLPQLGPDVGCVIRNRFEEKGVHVLVKSNVEKLEGTDAGVTGVVLTSGEKLPADMVVVGIGIEPPTEWLKGTRIELDDRGFIIVDDRFRTTADFVYAIGDSVTAPLPLWDIENINIQHFQLAQTHGHLLAYSIIGRPYPTQIVPFFWTLFFQEFGVRLAGCPEGSSNVILHGSLADLKFAKYYLKDDIVVAVASAGPTPTAVQFLELFKRKKQVTREDVDKNTTDDWLAFLNE
ncbi:unnamed protein product [Cylicocyclus nassatus]|uniref:Rieske domain-containing protein n=1 Tax=Cylicocyclus nassatus TaxID=53992 RepID=A0AA36DLI5_CYLNA|nr:unnamed protein product [Cylicocyclus nassatus]